MTRKALVVLLVPLTLGLVANAAIAASPHLKGRNPGGVRRQRTHPDGNGVLRRAGELRHAADSDGDGRHRLDVYDAVWIERGGSDVAGPRVPRLPEL